MEDEAPVIYGLEFQVMILYLRPIIYVILLDVSGHLIFSLKIIFKGKTGRVSQPTK